MSPCLPSIHVYSSVDTAVQCLLTLVTPDSCPVLCLKHSLSFLFAGLANGKVAVYHRKTGGELGSVPTLTWCWSTRHTFTISHCSSNAGAKSSDSVLNHEPSLFSERLWDVDVDCRLVSLGSEPVCSLLTVEDAVWASCANQVTVIQGSSLHTQVRHFISNRWTVLLD